MYLLIDSKIFPYLQYSYFYLCSSYMTSDEVNRLFTSFLRGSDNHNSESLKFVPILLFREFSRGSWDERSAIPIHYVTVRDEIYEWKKCLLILGLFKKNLL